MITLNANSSEIVARDALTAAQMEAMYELLAQHFDGVTKAQFHQDLATKNRVILMTRDDRLVGFSTMLAYTTAFEGTSINIIYSGDTIVAPEAWGTMALPRAWVTAVNELRSSMQPGRCYWLLLTSGFRTYRFLPVFWREFYPCFERATPGRQQLLLSQLAQHQFGSQFDPATGVVRFLNPQKLGHGLDTIPTGREGDPHIAFFARRNPGHMSGDELVCLTELCAENLTAAGRRMSTTSPRESTSDHR